MMSYEYEYENEYDAATGARGVFSGSSRRRTPTSARASAARDAAPSTAAASRCEISTPRSPSASPTSRAVARIVASSEPSAAVTSERAFSISSPQVAAPPNGSAIVISDGSATRRIELAEMPADEFGYVLRAEESFDPPTVPLDENGQGTPYAVYGYGAQVAEIEVDLQLGTVKVIRITAAHDLGRVINPLLAAGQIEGGIAQGLGMALMEEYIPGRTENLHDYLIPSAGDMPVVDTIFIEKPDPVGPMGAKGLGEHVLIPTAPAILNAIRDASGAEIDQLPALPHRVLAAIKQAQGDNVS